MLVGVEDETRPGVVVGTAAGVPTTMLEMTLIPTMIAATATTTRTTHGHVRRGVGFV